MNEWITDRLPTEEDGWYVYDSKGQMVPYFDIKRSKPWKPIPKCEPYVKPKRFEVRILPTGYAVYDITNGLHEAYTIPTRNAAERIAAIYEEVMP